MIFRFIKSIYLEKPFYIGLLSCAVLYFLGYLYSPIYYLGHLFLVVLILFTITDICLLSLPKNPLLAERKFEDKISNGTDNEIEIQCTSKYRFHINLRIIDEVPSIFQLRNFTISTSLNTNETKKITYILRPSNRGQFEFKRLLLWSISPIGLVSKRHIFYENSNAIFNVYPSIIEMRKHSLSPFERQKKITGTQSIKQLGQSVEFEKIDDYHPGDDVRTINWKASAKKNQLMINQFREEVTQNVLLVLDKGRSMKMPFNNLSLLDYSINSALALSNIIMSKKDKVSLVTFETRVDDEIPFGNDSKHLRRILTLLYNASTSFKESDLEKPYLHIRTKIRSRSLIILFTNFDTIDSLKRQLPYLRKLNLHHQLLVLFFENNEYDALTKIPPKNKEEIYHQIIMEQFMYDKKMIVQELKKYGISSLLTKPENLTINSINQYLKIKQKNID